MSRSSRAFRRTRTIALGGALACALAFAAGGAVAAPRAHATPGPADTSSVREIRIDDEGIRVTGGTGSAIVKSGDIVINGRDLRDLRDLHGRLHGRHGMIVDTLGSVTIRDEADDEIVQFFKDVHVSKGQVVSQVVAILGNVKNDGVITGDCVSVLGSVVQGDSAVIQGEAVSVGGAVHGEAPGSRIDGGTTSVGFLPFSPLSFPSSAMLIGFGLLAFLLCILLSLLTGRLFPDRMVRIAETISQRTFLSLVLGLLSLPLAIMAGLLLLVTVIGIPLAVLLPFLFVLAAFVGFTAAMLLLGGRLLGRRPTVAGGMMGPIFAGTGFVTLFYVIGVPLMSREGAARVLGVGFLVLWLVIGTVCWMLGLGALLLSRIGQAPAPAGTAPAAPPPPPGYAPRPATPPQAASPIAPPPSAPAG